MSIIIEKLTFLTTVNFFMGGISSKANEIFYIEGDKLQFLLLSIIFNMMRVKFEKLNFKLIETFLSSNGFTEKIASWRFKKCGKNTVVRGC